MQRRRISSAEGVDRSRQGATSHDEQTVEYGSQRGRLHYCQGSGHQLIYDFITVVTCNPRRGITYFFLLICFDVIRSFYSHNLKLLLIDILHTLFHGNLDTGRC